MKKIKIFGLAASIGLLSACADFDPLEYEVEIPESIAAQNEINSYDDLKSYLDETSGFKLGTMTALPDFAGMGLRYRLMNRNFNEITPNTEVSHGAIVQADGSLSFGNLLNFFEVVEGSDVAIHWNSLVTHSNQNATYLNSIIAPLVIPGDEGTYLINFEDSEFGDNFPMHNGGSSVVVTDPVTQTGKVLNVLGAQTFPMFSITLPDGVTLGDVETLTFDFNGAGCCGLYGQGLRMGISDGPTVSTFTGYGSPASFGAPDGGWSRNAIILPFANMNLTASQKELNSFTLSVGSATGAANYFVDNLRLFWKQEGEIIEKTDEEIKSILDGELDQWIGGLFEIGKDHVKSWTVLSEPMSDENPSELRSGLVLDSIPAGEFYWQDHLGMDYGVKAFQLARQYGNNEDLLFVNENGLHSNSAKITGLLGYISYLENNGVQVDGISTSISIDLNASTGNIAGMLQQLAASGKLIKISSLEVLINSTQPTMVMLTRQADLYKEIVEIYRESVPQSQQGGITLGKAIDDSNSQLRQGLWGPTENVNRKPAYAGFVQGLLD